jgi:cytidine deaminase
MVRLLMKDKGLIRECRALALRAYAPYSKFHVAALARTVDGKLYRGVNMENASYGVTMCAEVGALMAANAAGDLAKIRSLIVAGGTVTEQNTLAGTHIVTPCGRCRQLIYEASCLGGRDIAVTSVSGDGTKLRRSTIRRLLPEAFGPDTLRGKKSRPSNGPRGARKRPSR